MKFREKCVNHCHLCNDLFTRDEVRDMLRAHAHEKQGRYPCEGGCWKPCVSRRNRSRGRGIGCKETAKSKEGKLQRFKDP